jgi:Flp pilus assembly protein TadD
MVNLGALLAEQGEEDQAEQWYRKAADAELRDG